MGQEPFNNQSSINTFIGNRSLSCVIAQDEDELKEMGGSFEQIALRMGAICNEAAIHMKTAWTQDETTLKKMGQFFSSHHGMKHGIRREDLDRFSQMESYSCGNPQQLQSYRERYIFGPYRSLAESPYRKNLEELEMLHRLQISGDSSPESRGSMDAISKVWHEREARFYAEWFQFRAKMCASMSGFHLKLSGGICVLNHVPSKGIQECPFLDCPAGWSDEVSIFSYRLGRPLMINSGTAHLAKNHHLLEKDNNFGISARDFYLGFM